MISIIPGPEVNREQKEELTTGSTFAGRYQSDPRFTALLKKIGLEK
jgi:hypothetical protein